MSFPKSVRLNVDRNEKLKAIIKLEISSNRQKKNLFGISQATE